MNDLLKYILAVGLVAVIYLPGLAQFSIAPQLNLGLPAGNAQAYATPRLGYGIEAGYQLADRWSATAAYDLYAFEVGANLDELDLNPVLDALLNLPETVSLDLSVSSWSGGIRYSIPYFKVVPFIGITASTNNIKVSGYGLNISRRYRGLAPVIGLEWPLASRWSVQTAARLQTIFLREDIPFVEDIIKEHLVFVPIQAGLVFQLDHTK